MNIQPHTQMTAPLASATRTKLTSACRWPVFAVAAMAKVFEVAIKVAIMGWVRS